MKVTLHIYDITKGMARQLSFPLLGKQIDGVWHTAIVCFGNEYFFGGSGISHCQPSGSVLGPPDETVYLGETSITKKLFHQYLSGLSKEEFRSDKYHLFHHNCNKFSNEVAQFLTGKKIPSYIIDLPQDVMSTPFGAMIAQFFENIQVQPPTPDGDASQFTYHSDDDDQTSDLSRRLEHKDSLNSVNSTSSSSDVGFVPETCKVDGDELVVSFKHLKSRFEMCTKNLDRLRCILEEVDFDFGNEDELRKDITESLAHICKDLQNSDGDFDSFKSLLVVLKATVLTLPKIFKYTEGDDIILMVLNKLQRGHVNQIKLLRVQFLTNLLSVYELRNHLLSIDSMLRTLVTMTVSSILDGPGPLIKEAGCCLAYSLSIVNMNEDHAFELSSALLHAINDLDEKTKARDYVIGALKNFSAKSEQVAELAKMIVPDICEKELQL